jgi:hypothetical protein
MSTTIAGHKLTDQQRTALDCVLDHLRQHGGDSLASAPNVSPAGDGRWVPILEIFPARNNRHNGLRRIVTRLAKIGVLKACEVSFKDGCVKAEPVEARP